MCAAGYFGLADTRCMSDALTLLAMHVVAGIAVDPVLLDQVSCPIQDAPRRVKIITATICANGRKVLQPNGARITAPRRPSCWGLPFSQVAGTTRPPVKQKPRPITLLTESPSGQGGREVVPAFWAVCLLYVKKYVRRNVIGLVGFFYFGTYPRKYRTSQKDDHREGRRTWDPK